MCHDPQTVARRHFVVTPYEADSNNIMVPHFPDACPLEEKDGRPCRLSTDHRRERKTGPCFPLSVMRCCTHDVAFTLYPPGYTPWGREKWAPVAPDGATLTSEASSQRFRGTYFDAALDAAEDVVWAREKEFEEDFRKPSFISQQCHLERALRLLGIKGTLTWRETVAQTLSIPGQSLYEAAQSAGSSDVGVLGRAVREVLDAIPTTVGKLFERIAACGAAEGLWPPLHVWQSHRHQLQPMTCFHEGTRAAVVPI